MWLRNAWNYFIAWLSPRDAGTSADIDEELLFHLRSAVRDRVDEGESFDAAWNDAERQLGSLKRHAAECRSVYRKGEDMWGRIAVVVMVGLAGVVTWSVLRMRAIEEAVSQQQQLVQQHHEAAKAARERASTAAVTPSHDNQRTDLTGIILDENGAPLGNARALVILKTWPGGRYRQEAFTADTDEQGAFRLPQLVPSNAQYAVQVAATQDGYAFQSVYQLKDVEPIQQPDPIEFRLQKAAAVTLVVRDRNGDPVADADIIPSSRELPGGGNHAIYFQASQPLLRKSDSTGKVSLSCFSEGDTAEIYVKLPGQDWVSRQVRIPSAGSTIEMTTTGEG